MKKFTLFLLLVVFLQCGCIDSSHDEHSRTWSANPVPEIDEPYEMRSQTNFTAILPGTWTGTNGSGTALGPDGHFELHLVSLTSTFSDVRETNSVVSTLVTATALWDAYQNGQYVRTITLAYSNERVEGQVVDDQTLRYTFPSQESKITIEVTSDTTATVTEEGLFGLGAYTYYYNASYDAYKL